jgi:glucose-6-phosphate 1-dehydrogenase
MFGGTGDLASRKLLPALYKQETSKSFDGKSKIIGIGSSNLSVEEYKNIVKKSLNKYLPNLKKNSDDLNRFLSRITYKKLDINNDSDWKKISVPNENITSIFYLAIPPFLYEPITKSLKTHKLVNKKSRIVIEKPIGSNLKTAKKINNLLSKAFKEEQIYRIDHYLGKEAVQNLLALRFANTIFEQSWSNAAIEHIQISVAENLGVEGRGEYYDQTGALRDMIQNHLLQILCLISMEPPVSISSESVRDEKLKVLKSLSSFNPENIKTDSVRARYAEGLSNGKPVVGYIDEKGVNQANNTETYVALKVFINNWRWAGVPFYIRTGKRLSSKISEITVRYKNVPHNIFSKNTSAASNQLVLRIHPDEGVDLRLNTKEPGVDGFNLEELPLDLNLDDYYELGHQDCYERLLLDVIRGNTALFVRKDEIEASWVWIDNIINLWKSEEVEMNEYQSGSWGPTESDLLLRNDGKKWKNGASTKK